MSVTWPAPAQRMLSARRTLHGKTPLAQLKTNEDFLLNSSPMTTEKIPTFSADAGFLRCQLRGKKALEESWLGGEMDELGRNAIEDPRRDVHAEFSKYHRDTSAELEHVP